MKKHAECTLEVREDQRDTPGAGPVASLWLNAEEAAAHLRLPSRGALYSAVARGSLPVHRLGRRVRFLRSELDQALRTGGLTR